MIAEKLSELYRKNHPDGKVIGGGVMDEDKYLFSKGRTMMLMKEVNDPNSKYDWDLPFLLRDIYNKQRPFYRMWKNVSRWVLCTQYSDLFYEDIKQNDLHEGLKLIATTNLKKTGGTGQSNYDDILNAAKLGRAEWMEEIHIIAPRMVVCAGTFDIVCKVLEAENQIQYSKSGAAYFNRDHCLFLDFVHPAYQVSDKLMFAYFKETYRSLLERDCFLN